MTKIARRLTIVFLGALVFAQAMVAVVHSSPAHQMRYYQTSRTSCLFQSNLQCWR